MCHCQRSTQSRAEQSLVPGRGRKDFDGSCLAQCGRPPRPEAITKDGRLFFSTQRRRPAARERVYLGGLWRPRSSLRAGILVAATHSGANARLLARAQGKSRPMRATRTVCSPRAGRQHTARAPVSVRASGAASACAPVQVASISPASPVPVRAVAGPPCLAVNNVRP